MRDKIALRQLQALPLDAKILMAQQRIRQWYNYFHGDVYISFSGGKDSTVLAHLVHGMYPNVPMVFSNTGLEYPEIRKFAEQCGAQTITPRMTFDKVISKYGYPVISKEVAEAIHYARKIINPSENIEGGGTATQERRRQEICGTRDDTERIRNRNESNSTGNGQYVKRKVSSRNHGVETGKPHKHAPGQASPKTVGGGTAKETSGESEDSENNCLGNSQFNKVKWFPLCQETQFMISHMCCDIMKKRPMAKYTHSTHTYPYLGSMASESRLREQAWIRHGCNAYDGLKKTSQPLSVWTEQDVLQYIRMNGLQICSVYGDILAVDDRGYYYEPLPGVECKLKCTKCQRTGCVYCGFGAQYEKGETRFQMLAKTHPKQYEYCMGGGQWVDNPNYDETAPVMDGEWRNWNPKKIWVPSKKGLGMKKVFDDINQIYGKDFIRYE